MGSTIISQEIEVKDYLDDPHLDTGTKAFLKIVNAGGPPLETLSKEDARKGLIDLQASVKVDLTGVDFSEKTISKDGYKVKLNIVRPEGNSSKLPAFIFIHGGGWILGDFPTHQRMVRDLVVRSGVAAVFVNYTPSPEAHYPLAINEIYAATKWLAENGNEIDIDGENLAIVGNSVGGNMANAVSLMAKEKGGPEIKLQILMWPVADANFETESFKLYGEQRFLTASLLKWMFDQYTTDQKEREEIYISPSHASVEQLKGLPPTLIQVAENDILRDGAELLGRKLDEAGVKVATIRYNGAIHDFGLLNGLANLPVTHSLFDLAATELKKYLC